MFALLLGAALAAPFVAFVFPLVAIPRWNKRIEPMDVLNSRSWRKHLASAAEDPHGAWTANEFEFDCAIEAYEGLIDDTAGRLK